VRFVFQDWKSSTVCHVLIIEDEALIAMNLQSLLSENGATSFDIADTEDQAVDAARAHRPDVILSDVNLKHGAGPAAVQRIRRLFGLLPVIFVTASPDGCKSCPEASRVLGKPLDEAAIAGAFRDARRAPPSFA
jgi:CheY-like chemotaxis protein